MAAGEPLELLVVGDVHGDWDEVDREFLERRQPAAAIFVGDFGDEDVGLIARIARVEVTKAVLLGNHDAWHSMSGRDLTRVKKQLELLGDAFLAYRGRAIAEGRVVLVGGRPFSWGGGWSRHKGIYERLFNIGDDVASTARIVAGADVAPEADVVLVGHNGPRGLGEGAAAIFGCDFRKPHVDWGDADLQHALARLRSERGRRVIATVAGHMHERVRNGGLRRRRLDEGGTTHLNSAVVPRHQDTAAGRLRHFLRVVLEPGRVAEAEDIWVDGHGEIATRSALLGG